MKFEIPTMEILVSKAEERLYGKETCSTDWTGCCYNG